MLAQLQSPAAQGKGLSSITGILLDQSGAVIPGGTVQVKDEATGDVYKAVSGQNGVFSFSSLKPGDHTLTASMPNFRQTVLKGLVLTSGVPQDVRVTLAIGGTTETVVVQAGAEAIQTAAASISSAVPTTIHRLPLQARASTVLALSPGIATGVGAGAGRGGAVVIDGVELRQRLDSIQEATVQTMFPGRFNTEAYEHIKDNEFQDVAQRPLSTFSIDVDTASYANLRRFLNNGQLPPKDSVRVEELINYFSFIKQFRAIGRFAWVFYYVSTLLMIYMVNKAYLNMQVQKRAAANLLIILIPLSLVYEGIYYHKNTGKDISRSANLFDLRQTTEQFREDIGTLRPDRYQAIVAFPFFYIGSENFGKPANNEIYRLSQLFSYHLHLPMFNSYLSRTSIQESKNIMQLMAGNFYNKEISRDIHSDKQHEVALNDGDERAGHGVGLGGVTRERLLLDAAADRRADPRCHELERLLELDANLGLAKGFAAEEHPASKGLGVGIRAETEMEVDVGLDLGDRVPTSLGESRLEVPVVARREIVERGEQDLLLVLEVVVDEPGRQVSRLGDVGDDGAVVAALGHDLHQRPRDLRPSLLGVRWSRHVCAPCARLVNQPSNAGSESCQAPAPE
jgi:hypothetical protein